jgi:predicted metalloprotease
MTFNDDANIRGGRVSKRGRNAGIAAGGGGIGLIAIFLISQLLGVDLTGIVDTGGGGSAEGTTLDQCQTGEDANENVDCRMQAAATSLDTFWSATLDGYVQPAMVIFEGATPTGCGNATSAVGPFYCPSDQTVYLDTSFFVDLRDRFGGSGGTLAQLYVVAHEWGHHIQNTTGIMEGLNLQQTGPTSDGVRLELQADCFAGAWVGAASEIKDSSGRPFLDPVTDAQIGQALDAAEAVGDDNIQETTTGQVQPETWTHGASEQRKRWFQVGLNQGVNACDTFGASANEL